MPLQHKLISWWMLSHPDDMKKKIRLAVFDVLTESLDPVAKCPASSPSESSKRILYRYRPVRLLLEPRKIGKR